MGNQSLSATSPSRQDIIITVLTFYLFIDQLFFWCILFASFYIRFSTLRVLFYLLKIEPLLILKKKKKTPPEPKQNGSIM